MIVVVIGLPFVVGSADYKLFAREYSAPEAKTITELMSWYAQRWEAKIFHLPP